MDVRRFYDDDLEYLPPEETLNFESDGLFYDESDDTREILYRLDEKLRGATCDFDVISENDLDRLLHEQIIKEI